jgi:hypothetical protein
MAKSGESHLRSDLVVVASQRGALRRRPDRCYKEVMNATRREGDDELDALNAGAFDEAGVDLTQIDMMLALEPAERLAMLYQTALSLSRLMNDADADARV